MVVNLLPCDGVVEYHPHFIDEKKSLWYLKHFLNGMPWRHEELFLFGRQIILSRKVAWFGDVDYHYAGGIKIANPWTKELLELKELLECFLKVKFNACLLNLYHDGQEGMGWHSDNEKSIEPDSVIASLSLGSARLFSFKHHPKNLKTSLILDNGSLLVMKGVTQRFWKHSLPKTKKSKEIRINLTFRTMVGP
jgi:alkylated DNA repair dioxygenase AlkB